MPARELRHLEGALARERNHERAFRLDPDLYVWSHWVAEVWVAEVWVAEVSVADFLGVSSFPQTPKSQLYDLHPYDTKREVYKDSKKHYLVFLLLS
jgi:hypothetical protein